MEKAPLRCRGCGRGCNEMKDEKDTASVWYQNVSVTLRNVASSGRVASLTKLL
jgi:uncharacterized cysteine cluster protein YcgN (CxxCxxCC family)